MFQMTKRDLLDGIVFIAGIGALCFYVWVVWS